MYDPMEAIGRTRDDIVRGSGAFREATDTLGPVTAKDDTGAVTVTIDGDGRISSILVSMTWKNRDTSQYAMCGARFESQKSDMKGSRSGMGASVYSGRGGRFVEAVVRFELAMLARVTSAIAGRPEVGSRRARLRCARRKTGAV